MMNVSIFAHQNIKLVTRELDLGASTLTKLERFVKFPGFSQIKGHPSEKMGGEQIGSVDTGL